MKRIALQLVAVTMLVLVSGCFDASTTVFVKKDGSGLVVETVYINAAAEKMMTQMMDGMAGADASVTVTGSPANPKLEEDKYRAKAKDMGEGVKYVKAKEVKNAAGATGVRVYYSFTDITKLKLATDPEPPGGDAMGGMGGMGAGKEEGPPDVITFQFTKGDPAKLVVNIPEDEAEEGFEDEEEDIGDFGDEAEAPEPDAMEMEMMKMMFKGLRFRMTVKVDGEIVDSNASFVAKSRQSGKKQYVTLFDIDFEKLMQDPEAFKKLGVMGEPDDMSAAMDALAAMPGMKVETESKVEITFK